MKPVIYDPTQGVHRPTQGTETLDVLTLPISVNFFNQLQIQNDGLYVGPLSPAITYYVASNGIDDNSHGTQAQPFKTLDFCLSYLVAVSRAFFSTNVKIALKAGESFDFTQSFSVNTGGKLTLTFFGDPNYGDYNSPLIGAKARPATMSDLQRPQINVGIEAGTSGCASFLMNGSSALELLGVRVNMPQGNHLTGYYDLCSMMADSDSKLNLIGSIVNLTSPTSTSPFGLCGITPDAKLGSVYQYASQLWIDGLPVSGSSTTAQLLGRQWFFKLYPDYAGAHQDGIDIFNGAPGTSVLNVSWSDIAAQPVVGSVTNLPTYPLLQDPGQGLRNYFYNLQRDQQQRPTNVISGRPLP